MNQSSHNDQTKQTSGFIGYGNQTKRGNHNHRTNQGSARTPKKQAIRLAVNLNK